MFIQKVTRRGVQFHPVAVDENEGVKSEMVRLGHVAA